MNTFWTPRFRLAWILIFVAAINSLGWTLYRWSYENSQRGAQITVDYDDTRTMADAFGIEHETFLRELKSRGVTSLGIYEQTLGSLREAGQITVVTRAEAQALYPEVEWNSHPGFYRHLITVTPDNQVLTWQLLNRIREQAAPGQAPRTVVLQAAPAGQPRNAGQFGILVPASRQLFNDAKMGFDPAQLALTKKLGLTVTARLSNALNLNLPRVRALLDDVQKTGAKVVIFSEDEVLGYDSLIRDVGKEMRERGLLFGNIEFTRQRGWQGFAARSDGQLVRVHSVGPEEASKSAPEVLTERFARAVKERNIRVAYIRLIRHFKGEYTRDSGGSEPQLRKSALDQNYAFIEGVARELRHQPLPIAALRPGLNLTTAQGFGNYPYAQLGGDGRARVIRYVGLFLSSLGMVGAGLLLLNLFFDWNRDLQKRRLILGLGIAVLLLFLDFCVEMAQAGSTHPLFKIFGMWPNSFGVKLMAMGVGCFFSAIGVLWGGLPKVFDEFSKDDAASSSVASPKIEFMPTWLRGIGVLLQTSAVMMIGPLIIIALLNHWRFFSGADKFFFPKLTQLVPLVIVALAFAGAVFPHRVMAEGAAAARLRMQQWFRNLLDQPFTARVALIGGFLLVLGFIWIARTGNESGMEISSFELRMRALLEQIFITRPRTKEIFLGHPAVLFAVYFAYRRQWLPAFAATVVATIGQADMLNTFCHLHTPLFYSFLRSIHAIWLGTLIGGAALWIYHKLTMPRAFTSYKGTPLPPNHSSPAGKRASMFEPHQSDTRDAEAERDQR